MDSSKEMKITRTEKERRDNERRKRGRFLMINDLERKLSQHTLAIFYKPHHSASAQSKSSS